MNIINANIFGSVKNVRIEDGVITEITDRPLDHAYDAKGNRLIPGLIDIHTHGFKGLETHDKNFEVLARSYAQMGITSFLPTTSSQDFELLVDVTNTEIENIPGAHILGFHMEGPFLNKEFKGGMLEKHIIAPDVEKFRRCKNVKMITVAPEVEGALDFIDAVSSETIISLGHTAADYETTLKAFDHGAKILTHTFNAMKPLLKREPGPIGACVERHMYAQLICDGYHVQKPVILAAYRMFGPDRVCMISDSVQVAGLPNGEYMNTGKKVIVKDKTICLPNGTISGCYLSLFEGFQKVLEFGVPFEDAVRMASTTPAELLGVKKGRIEAGYDADLLIIDYDNNLKTVIIDGEVFHEN